MRRICGNVNSGGGIFLFAVIVLTILIVQPCFSECEFDWKPDDGLPSLSSYVSAVTNWDPDGKGPRPALLVAGGEFTTAGGVSANRAAAWDGNSWQALGSGTNNSVLALTVYNGQLIAGGRFTTAGGVDANCIAAWDGNSWRGLGSGMGSGGTSSVVRVLTVYNGELIAGGTFATAGSADVNSIAAWDGNDWHALGSGVGGLPVGYLTVISLTVYDGELIAGGTFDEAGGVDANHIAAWDGNSWHALGSGMDGPSYHWVYSLTVCDGELIAGGDFATAGGVEANRIAAWNGGSWRALGSGMNFYINALTIYNGQIIAGGPFTTADGIDVNNIARWDGSNWHSLGSGMNNEVRALTIYEGKLIAGGRFTTAGNYASAYIAMWGVPEVYKGDLNHDCGVGYSDLGLFVKRWLDEDCLYNGWCYEADLNYDGGVGFLDYAELATNWLEGD